MSKLSATSSFVAGTVIAKKYRLIRQLGQGAMGVVWSAQNVQTSGDVALKLLTRPEPDLRPRLIREAQACCQIRHKNVIQVQDVGQTDDGDPFLVMELLSGETLAELLERKRRLSQKDAAAIGRDVARALAAAHDKGIVHRDLKPANIFLHNQPGEDARVIKVLDFGVSKNLMTSDGLRTAVGHPIGSPMYMSPEQARCAPDIDARADIWSLGVLLFEMLTGGRPFDGEVTEAIQKILIGEIPTVSRRRRDIDAQLERIVAGCLRREREQRQWPAAEVASMLDAFVTGGAGVAAPSLAETWKSSDHPVVAPAATPKPPRAPCDIDTDAETQKLLPRVLESAARQPAPPPAPGSQREAGGGDLPGALDSSMLEGAPTHRGTVGTSGPQGTLKVIAPTVKLSPDTASQATPPEPGGASLGAEGPTSTVPPFINAGSADAAAAGGSPPIRATPLSENLPWKKGTILFISGSLVSFVVVTGLLLHLRPRGGSPTSTTEAAAITTATSAPAFVPAGTSSETPATTGSAPEVPPPPAAPSAHVDVAPPSKQPNPPPPRNPPVKCGKFKLNCKNPH